jgi:hypothetical protein
MGAQGVLDGEGMKAERLLELAELRLRGVQQPNPHELVLDAEAWVWFVDRNRSHPHAVTIQKSGNDTHSKPSVSERRRRDNTSAGTHQAWR